MFEYALYRVLFSFVIPICQFCSLSNKAQDTVCACSQSDIRPLILTPISLFLQTRHHLALHHHHHCLSFLQTHPYLLFQIVLTCHPGLILHDQEDLLPQFHPKSQPTDFWIPLRAQRVNRSILFALRKLSFQIQQNPHILKIWRRQKSTQDPMSKYL